MNDLTKLIFEKLRVEPNEWFYVSVNGKKDDCIFYISDSLVVWYEEDGVWRETSWTINYFITEAIKIIKIPKVLLTDEEREFLKFWKSVKSFKRGENYLVITRLVSGNESSTHMHIGVNFASGFCGLENGKEYTPKDLDI